MKQRLADIAQVSFLVALAGQAVALVLIATNSHPVVLWWLALVTLVAWVITGMGCIAVLWSL